MDKLKWYWKQSYSTTWYVDETINANITILKSVQNYTKDIGKVHLPKKFYEKYKNKRHKIRKERFKKKNSAKNLQKQ